MFERLLVKRCDVGCSPLMIRVTRATHRALLFAVQSAFHLQIHADVLVTIDAQFVLRILVEWRMAALALLLDFGVTTNDLTRHQCRFERLRANRPYR